MSTTVTPRNRHAPSVPRFLQGAYALEGKGVERLELLDPALSYTVPRDRDAQLVYFRGGNSGSELASVVIVRDGEPMRWFPIGAKGSTHVALRVVENLPPGTVLEVHAASDADAHVIVDLGLVEI